MTLDFQQKQAISDKADAAHTLASVTSAQLEYHAAEDQRMFTSINNKIENIEAKTDKISEDIEAIKKLIWIATGIMMTLTTLINFVLIYHHG